MNKKLVALLVMGVTMRLMFFNHTADDAYITFRYSQNLVDGKGFVYNPGENVLGITNPLYGLAIAGGMSLGLDPVLFSKLIGVIGFLAISLIGWGFLKKRYGSLAAYSFVLMFAIDHYTSRWFMSGMETALFSFLAFLACVSFVDGKELLAGVLAGASLFVRPEGGFILPVMFLLSKEKKKIVPGIAIAITFFIFSQALYGFPVPYSIYAKTVLSHGSSFSNLVESGYHVLNFILKEPFPAFFLIFAPFELLVFVATPALIFLSYLVLRTPVFLWYFAPYYPLLFLASATGLARFSTMLVKYQKQFALLILAFIAIHQIGFGVRELYLLRDSNENFETYKEFAINVSTTNSKIVIGDIGVVGYYSNQYIFDLAGLVSPKALECRVENRLTECIQELQPDYFVAGKGSYQEAIAAEAGCSKILHESKLHRFFECDKKTYLLGVSRLT